MRSKICIKFCVKLEHSSAETICRWPRLWTADDWQLHHNNVPAHASHLIQFFGETTDHPSNSAPYSPDLVPWDFWLFPKPKSPLKGKRLQMLMRFRKIWWGSWWWLGELYEAPRWFLWRGLRHHCPMSNVSCISYLLQNMVPFFTVHDWILSGQTSYSAYCRGRHCTCKATWQRTWMYNFLNVWMNNLEQ